MSQWETTRRQLLSPWKPQKQASFETVLEVQIFRE
jgi:hypothetical protein